MVERSDAWSDFELHTLYEFVNEEEWLDEACELLPARTRNAITTRMSALRREAEITPKRRGGKAMSERNHNRSKTAAATQKLAIALLALDEAAAPALSEHDRREIDTLRCVQLERVDSLIEPGRELQLEFFNGPLFEWRHAA